MKLITTLVFGIASAAISHAQLQEACINVTAGFLNTSQAGVVQTPDGGFVTAGRHEPINTGSYHVGVTKLDANGVLQWMKYYVGGSGIDWPMAVINTSDGGLAVAGVSDNMGARGMFILKLDASGDEQWTKAYTSAGFGLQLNSNSFIQMADGGFAMVGSPGFGQDGWHFLRTDAVGDLLWSDRMDFDPNIPTDVGELPNGDLVYTGWGGDEAFVMRKDGLTGTNEWMNWYGATEPYIYPHALVVGPDSTIVIAGLIAAAPLASYDAFAFAVDADGTPGWFSRISGADVERADDIALHPAGGYVLCSNVQSSADLTIYLSGFAARLDSSGQLLWSKRITSPDVLQERFERCAVTADGGILLADQNTQVLVKLDPNGNTCPYCPSTDAGTLVSVVPTLLPDEGTSTFGPWATPATLTFTVSDVTGTAAYSICGTSGVEDLAGTSTASIAPNPFSRSAVLTFDPARITGEAWIELRDVLGRVVQRQRVVGQSNTIDRANLAEGSYAWCVIDASGIIASGKVEVVND